MRSTKTLLNANVCVIKLVSPPSTQTLHNYNQHYISSFYKFWKRLMKLHDDCFQWQLNQFIILLGNKCFFPPNFSFSQIEAIRKRQKLGVLAAIFNDLLSDKMSRNSHYLWFTNNVLKVLPLADFSVYWLINHS